MVTCIESPSADTCPLSLVPKHTQKTEEILSEPDDISINKSCFPEEAAELRESQDILWSVSSQRNDHHCGQHKRNRRGLALVWRHVIRHMVTTCNVRGSEILKGEEP